MNGGAPAQAQAPRPGGQSLQNLIRPEQVARLPHLTTAQKQETEGKVSRLWEFITNSGSNSNDPRYQQALQELTRLSAQLMQGMKQFKERQQAQAQAKQASQGQTQGQNQSQGQGQQATGATQAQQANSALSFAQLLPEVQQRVNQQTFCYPPAMTEGSAQATQWLQEAKARYGQAIQRAQMAKNKKTELQRAAQSRAATGNPLTQDEHNGLSHKLAQCDKAIREAQSFMEKFKEQQEQFKNNRPQQKFTQPGAQPVVTGGENQSEGQGAGQQVQAGPQAYSIATAQAAARANATNSVTAPGASQPAGTVTSGSQSTPIEQVQQNPMMIAQPNASRPSTATQPGPPSAIHPSVQTGVQASHAHPNVTANAHPLSSAVNGMKAHPPPIPKNLQVADPTPVQMPPSRPTLNGGANVGLPGQIAQPALTTFPGYVLEQSEDGHLLSKKKLHDLVREVVGPNSDDQLTPEAEEICLNLLDDFVEDVITSGCRLAKLRGATSLEPRDCMVVLERQYNMRIPGFSTDEVRTVRKNQPAAGWAHKVSAVQAAKLMNGSGGGAGVANVGAATTSGST
ncbi:Transcription initiation factor TFIID subunit 12 [Lithohypha guttulata]|uniref:Transcription initiation factor TFIID subunit 12 n=1 Tax=Lithohypha guttulata TaxID=1690604 RepID=UPI002DDE815D|nr:Transcription initiation factor TFIID subunit 12 [Lithohypha guttulata]